MPNINVPKAIDRIARDLERTKDHALYYSGIPAQHSSKISRRLDDVEKSVQILRGLVSAATSASVEVNARRPRRRG
jgi:hypothetical protein